MYPRIMPEEQDLLNLAQKGYDPDDIAYASREEAHEQLVLLAKQDFGYDVDAWLKWLKENIKDWDEFGLVDRILKGKRWGMPNFNK